MCFRDVQIKWFHINNVILLMYIINKITMV